MFSGKLLNQKKKRSASHLKHAQTLAGGERDRKMLTLGLCFSVRPGLKSVPKCAGWLSANCLTSALAIQGVFGDLCLRACPRRVEDCLKEDHERASCGGHARSLLPPRHPTCLVVTSERKFVGGWRPLELGLDVTVTVNASLACVADDTDSDCPQSSVCTTTMANTPTTATNGSPCHRP